MVDESPDLEPEERDDEPEPEKRRSLAAVIVTVIVIVLIVLAFLLIRGCGSGRFGGTTTNGDKVIVPVRGMKPQAGAVSVWVKTGSDIDTVLTAAAVRGGDVVNMGGDRYVVAVPVGSESAIVTRLKGVTSVVDAGLVYSTGGKR